MSQYVINIPLTVPFGSRDYGLNLNHYRNAHHAILNGMKQNFTSLISEEILKLPQFKAITLDYILFTGTKRKIDLMNVGSIVDKFFCDALVAWGRIPDDNTDVISSMSFAYGGYDKALPRMEVTIFGDPV